MKIKSFRFLLIYYTNIILLLLTTICFYVPFQPVKAQIAGEGLTISPPILELTLKPGDKSTQIIKITNPTKQLMEVYPKVMNFGASGEDGEPAFYPASEEETKFSLAHWIKFNQTKLALTENQVVEFEYQIQVPLDAEPGGHYGVVFLTTEPPKSNENISQVSIGSMIGSLILVKVPGAIIEKGFLEQFTTKTFYFKPPVDFTTKIANLGNVHFKPKGNITIKNWQGAEIEKIPVNTAKGNVLPDSTRKFEEKWGASKYAFGRFTANLNIVYGENEKTLDGQIVFWIVPWWIIVAIISFIIIIISLIWYLKKRKERVKNQFYL